MCDLEIHFWDVPPKHLMCHNVNIYVSAYACIMCYIKLYISIFSDFKIGASNNIGHQLSLLVKNLDTTVKII